MHLSSCLPSKGSVESQAALLLASNFGFIINQTASYFLAFGDAKLSQNFNAHLT